MGRHRARRRRRARWRRSCPQLETVPSHVPFNQSNAAYSHVGRRSHARPDIHLRHRASVTPSPKIELASTHRPRNTTRWSIAIVNRLPSPQRARTGGHTAARLRNELQTPFLFCPRTTYRPQAYGPRPVWPDSGSRLGFVPVHTLRRVAGSTEEPAWPPR